MSASLITHEGKEIAFGDFRGDTGTEAQLKTVEALAALLAPVSGPTLSMANFEGINPTSETMKRLTEVGKEFRSKVTRNAVLGITGYKATLLAGYKVIVHDHQTEVFKTEAEALDWLVS
jgi:hypothetical protein